MKTIIISSSISSSSRSLIMCKKVEGLLNKALVDCKLIDAKTLNLLPCHNTLNKNMKELSRKIENADNIIIGMGVHCYSINDSLKIILDTCFSGAKGKFFGIICAAGGEKSYLSSMHLTQICMNEWRMIQLPRILYATGNDFDNDNCKSDLDERVIQFVDDFILIGKKLVI